MNETTLQVIQREIFDLFRIFDKICREQSLRYYFLGGTMLGAIRHRGFIPWDDDIDVGMPRADYNKLLSYLSSEKNGDTNTLEVFNAATANRCSYDFTKLRRDMEFNGKHFDVFVDIFPLDGCPYESEFGIKLYYQIFNLLRIMKNSHFMTMEGKSIVKRIIVHLLRLRSLDSYQLRMNQYLMKHSFDDSKTVGNFSGHWGAKEIMKKEVYGAPTPVFFVDREYMGVAQPDAYLTRMYGDYMKLPSEEDRLSHFKD